MERMDLEYWVVFRKKRDVHQDIISRAVYMSLIKIIVLGCHGSDKQIINGAIRKKKRCHDNVRRNYAHMKDDRSFKPNNPPPHPQKHNPFEITVCSCNGREEAVVENKPCLIAKLMGLEELPSSEKVQFIKKSVEKNNFSNRLKSLSPLHSSCSSFPVHIQMPDMERKNTRSTCLNKRLHSRLLMKPDRTQLRSRYTNKTAEDNKESNHSFDERKPNHFFKQTRQKSGNPVKERKMSTYYSYQCNEESKFCDTNIPKKRTHGCEEKEEDTVLRNQLFLANKLAECRRKNTQNTKTESKTQQMIHHTNDQTKKEDWDQDWNIRFSIEDLAQVVCDLENLMTVMLVEEVFMELVF